MNTLVQLTFGNQKSPRPVLIRRHLSLQSEHRIRVGFREFLLPSTQKHLGPFLSSESTHEGYDRRVGREIAFCLQESSSLGQRSVDSHSVRARVDDPQRSSRQPVVCIHMLGQFLMPHSAKINRASTDRSRDQWKTPSRIDDFIAVYDREPRGDLLEKF